MVLLGPKKGFKNSTRSVVRAAEAQAEQALKQSATVAQEVEAVGRALSEKNAATLSEGIQSIEAGVASIRQVLAAADIVESAPVETSASAFTESVASKAWFSQFRVSLYYIQSMFLDLCCRKLDYINRNLSMSLNSEEDRRQAIRDTIEEGIQALQTLSNAYPERGNDAHRSMYCEYDYFECSSNVEAGALSNAIAASGWLAEIETVFTEFGGRFIDLHSKPLSNLPDMPDEASRQAGIDELLSDLKSLLTKLASGAPEALGVAAAAATPKAPQPVGDASESLTMAASVSIPGTCRVSSQISVTLLDNDGMDGVPELIQAKASQGGKNLHPVRGVLFRVDEASEASPKVGPSMPLYIPAEVARRALDVANMPLEASDNLSDHDRLGTCGVMATAELVDKDFVVSGYVWPWNHSEKVSAMLSASEELGMSMNAEVVGRPVQQAGQKVFWVEELRLLGAAILFSELATYKKTRLAASSAQNDSSNLQPVAASAQAATTQDPQGEEIMSQEVLNQLQALSDQVKNTYDQLSSKVGEFGDRLQVLEKERTETLQAASAQAQQENRRAEQESLVKAIGETLTAQVAEVLPEMIAAHVSQVVNPRGVPARRTASVIAGTQQQPSGAANPLQAELLQLTGALNYAREHGGDRAARMRMQQRINEINSQLSGGGSIATV